MADNNEIEIRLVEDIHYSAEIILILRNKILSHEEQIARRVPDTFYRRQ
ncbi:MAG: hypothetical protein ACYDEE_10485 [Ignavibacteriaceae bacterium]